MIKELLVCMLSFSNNIVISKSTDVVNWDNFKKSCKENGGLIILSSVCVIDENYDTASPPEEKTEIDIVMSNVQIVKIVKHAVTFRLV